MPLMKSIARFASSRQGRQLFGKAKAYAASPEGKAKIEKARKQIASRGSGSKPKPQ